MRRFKVLMLQCYYHKKTPKTQIRTLLLKVSGPKCYEMGKIQSRATRRRIIHALLPSLKGQLYEILSNSEKDAILKNSVYFVSFYKF
jgi:hypothetical protein